MARPVIIQVGELEIVELLLKRWCKKDIGRRLGKKKIRDNSSPVHVNEVNFLTTVERWHFQQDHLSVSGEVKIISMKVREVNFW